MAYDLEEQEQIDELKAWWKRNGNHVLLAAVVVFTSMAGFQAWKTYQFKQSAQASVLYQTLIQADEKEIKTIQSNSAQLIEHFKSTPYAGRAALTAAKANYAAKDTKSAKAQLEWAVKNAQEASIKTLALLQLAAIQLDEKAYDAALKTLAEKHEPGFEGLFADLKGDILAAQGKKEEAKTAYQLALQKLDAEGSYIKYTQYKLEALGS